MRSDHNQIVALAAFGLALHSAHQTCPAAECADSGPPHAGLVSQYSVGCRAVADCTVQNARQARAPTRIRLGANGQRHLALDTSRRDRSQRAFAKPLVACPRRRTSHGRDEPETEELLPWHPRYLERGLSERGQGEVDGEHRLLPRDHGGPSRSEGDRSEHEATVARAGRGPDVYGGPMRQRLRLRLPEQPFLVVPDHAAATGSPRTASRPCNWGTSWASTTTPPSCSSTSSCRPCASATEPTG